MSEENVTTFRVATEALNRGDLDGWLACFREDCVFEPLLAALEGTYHGHAGLRDFIRTLGAHYESFQADIDDVRDLGDRVLALGVVEAIGRRSRIQQRVPVAIVARFEDGRVSHFKDFGDRERALQAAGLSE